MLPHRQEFPNIRWWLMQIPIQARRIKEIILLAITATTHKHTFDLINCLTSTETTQKTLFGNTCVED